MLCRGRYCHQGKHRMSPRHGIRFRVVWLSPQQKHIGLSETVTIRLLIGRSG